MLGALRRSCALAQQVLGAVVLLLRELERGLRLVDLLLRLIDARLLGFNLGAKIFDIGVRLVNLPLGLRERRPIVAVVELRQNGAGRNELIVGDGNVHNRPADLRADLHGVGVDESIISGFEPAGIQPPDNPKDDKAGQQGQEACNQVRMLPRQSAD